LGLDRQQNLRELRNKVIGISAAAYLMKNGDPTFQPLFIETSQPSID
jgi:hypothetical protein